VRGFWGVFCWGWYKSLFNVAKALKTAILRDFPPEFQLCLFVAFKCKQGLLRWQTQRVCEVRGLLFVVRADGGPSEELSVGLSGRGWVQGRPKGTAELYSKMFCKFVRSG